MREYTLTATPDKLRSGSWAAKLYEAGEQGVIPRTLCPVLMRDRQILSKVRYRVERTAFDETIYQRNGRRFQPLAQRVECLGRQWGADHAAQQIVLRWIRCEQIASRGVVGSVIARNAMRRENT
jgi:hypothetical protein